MRAMVLRGARDLVADEVDAPRPPAGYVIVKVTHTGICGTDLKIFAGAIPVSYPRIMGHEIVGELADGGNGTFRRGERVIVDPVVYCGVCNHCRAGRTNLCPDGTLLGRDADGGFAEYVAVPQSNVFKLPDAVSAREAAAIQVLTTCLHAQRRAPISAGQSVVVSGLGVTGQLHVQLAKARGARVVVGVTRSSWKQQLARELGADETVAVGDGLARRVVTALGDPPDVVIETTGVMSSIADAIAMVRPGGTLVLFGITTAAEGALPFYELYFKELTIVNARAAKGEDFPESIDLVARGAVKLLPLITHAMPLSELAPAIQLLKSDVDGRMKIVMEHGR